jgi:hypothetical protein
MVKELAAIVNMETWSAVDVSKCTAEELDHPSSSMFSERKYSPMRGVFQKLKARLSWQVAISLGQGDLHR